MDLAARPGGYPARREQRKESRGPAVMSKRLTKADVSRLLADPSGESRADAAAKIAGQYENGILSPREREIAEEIIRLMARDAEVRVREALATHLKACDELPPDVARTLASDVDSVALPMLQFSSVLTDPDLIAVVRGTDVGRQVAVASRNEISASVAQSLAEHGFEPAVAALMGNAAANVEERAFQTALDRFPASVSITANMVHRAKLPVTVAERLVTLVSDALKDHLVTNHDLSESVATDLVMQSRERATVGLLSPDADDAAAARLIQSLRANGRLTPSLMLRALCMGDVTFFEVAIAALAGVPVANARKLAHDQGSLGLKALYDKAHLPDSLYSAFRAAVDVIHETEFNTDPRDRGQYRRRVMERILTQFDHLGAIGGENLDYLVAKLSKLEVA